MKLNLCVKRRGEVLFEVPLLEGVSLSLNDETGRVVSELQPEEHISEDGERYPLFVVSDLEPTVVEEREHTSEQGGAEAQPQEINPAEVWSCENGEWRYQGSLSPGQQARMGEGYVRLEREGSLRVSPGPRLEGVAILPTGNQLEIQPGGGGISLPAGSCVTMVTKARSFYVRSDFIDQPPVEHANEPRDNTGDFLEVLVSDLS